MRCVWGGPGARYLTESAQGQVLAIVVDVLSFSTSVSVAVDRGAVVYPYRWRDSGAAHRAKEVGAALAVNRPVRAPGAPAPTSLSLSPASIAAAPAFSALVLPSPNGSTISSVLSASGATVVAGCLRNARAVGEYAERHRAAGGVVIVVPAGERWPDGSLRPAIEDLWGAGAICSMLAEGARSPETEVAVDAFRAVKRQLARALQDCSSGLELADLGYADDVTYSAALNASRLVPVLSDGCFRAARP